MKKAALLIAPLLVALLGCGNRSTAPGSASAAPGGAATEPAPAETAQPAQLQPPPVELAAGTVLRVRLNQALDTARNRAGDRFEATLVSPVSVQGNVILPKDTHFHGQVTASQPSGRLHHRGYINLKLDSFVLNGETYRIATSSKREVTGAHKKRNAVLIGGGSGLGALIGGLAGGGKGVLIGAASGAAAGTAGAAITGKKNVHLPAETVLSFTLHSPVALEPEPAGASEAARR
jgi:outer membrane lipoprotein SlyB